MKKKHVRQTWEDFQITEQNTKFDLFFERNVLLFDAELIGSHF